MFPVLPECANPALKEEWPVHMLLLRVGVATALEAGRPSVAAGTSPARCRRGRAGALALAVAPLVAAAGGGDQRHQFSILEHSRPASR